MLPIPLNGFSAAEGGLLKSYSIYLIMILLTLFSVGCSQVTFETTTASNAPNSQSTPSAMPQAETTAQRKISYPTSSIVTNSPFLGVQSVMSMIADLDKKSCTIKVSMSLMQDPTCYELPEFCEEKNTETLTNNDFTCEQTLRARAILASRQEESCRASNQALSAQEIQQINNPNAYLLPNKLAVLLPNLKSIALDETCNCTYGTQDNPSFAQYKLPALPEHCLAHFPSEYKIITQ